MTLNSGVLSDASDFAGKFFGDRVTYTNGKFYSRKRGINKDIPEEFDHLLLLAEHLMDAMSVRLSPNSLPGPDGAILLADKSEITVQVTVAHERSDGYKVRQSLRDNGTWMSKVSNTNEVIEQRLKRIFDAIIDKESNFHVGTDILLIVDESISWGDVIDPGLPESDRNLFLGGIFFHLTMNVCDMLFQTDFRFSNMKAIPEINEHYFIIYSIIIIAVSVFITVKIH